MPRLDYNTLKILEKTLIEEITATNRIVHTVKQLAKDKNDRLIARIKQLKEL